MSETSNGDPPATVLRVIAKYKFEGKNNDELSFAKNDVITVLQQLEGGWWEGALGENIGWFPSSFVGIIKTDIERKHIDELVRLVNEFLSLILESNVVPTADFTRLSASINEIIDVKKDLVEQLNNTLTKEIGEQRNHPNIMTLVNKHREKIEEALKTEKLQIKDLRTGLSLVFRHTEKYSTVLQEVERNTPNNHSDRGNLQRAAAVYRDIAEDSAQLRKQKETQLEFLESNVVEKTVGKEAANRLGDLVYINSVTISLADAKEEDEDALLARYFVLFTNSALFYEAQLEAPFYVLKENIPVGGIVCLKDENALRTSFIKNSKLLLTINSLTDVDYRNLTAAIDRCAFAEVRSGEEVEIRNLSPILPHKLEANRAASMSPIKHVDVSQMPQPMRPQIQQEELDLNETRAQKPPPGPAAANSTVRVARNAKLYSGWCLRPYPPPRGGASGLQTTASSSSIKMRKGLTIEEQDDAYLLKIVEGYCGPPSSGGLSSSFNRMHTSTSSQQTRRATSFPEEMRPQLIMADDEKIFVEEVEGDSVVVKEKSLVDTVYALKDQLTALQQEVATMNKTVHAEQRARRRLEEALRRMSHNYSHSSSPKPDQTDSGST
ncbi:hypothetical protein M3Y99_00031500 [Aphelenchoides fujianensis]|nr:hypothetical protein M3Y99_00031500 [Aphelenchoides fujianensis]